MLLNFIYVSSLNDAIPTIVPREQSALNQDVVTDSVPFQQPDPAKKPSVTSMSFNNLL